MRGGARWVVLVALAALAPVVLRAQGKVEASVPLAELEKRVRTDSNDAAAHYNVAVGYWQATRWADVDRQLRTAIALEPRFAEAHLALAFLPFARDPKMLEPYRSSPTLISALPASIQAALKQRTDEYRRAFVIDPMVDLRMIAASTTDIDYRLKDYFFGSVFGRYIDGLSQCQQGKYSDCENTLTVVISDLIHGRMNDNGVPNDAYWYRGIAAAHVKHFDVAIADFNKLITRDQAAVQKAEGKGLIRSPMRTNEYRYFLAVFQQAAGRYDEAIGTYRQAAEGDLGLYMAHVRLAEIYEVRKELPKAVEERRNAINSNPDDPTLQMDLGVTLGKAGNFADAETALKTATDALPRDFSAWYWAGIAEQQLGRKAEAKNAFEQVVTLAPSRLPDLVAKAKQHLAVLQ